MDTDRSTGNRHAPGQVPTAGGAVVRAGSQAGDAQQPRETQQPRQHPQTQQQPPQPPRQAPVTPMPPPPHAHHQGLLAPGEQQHRRPNWHGGGLQPSAGMGQAYDHGPRMSQGGGVTRASIQPAWGTHAWNNAAALTYPSAGRARTGPSAQQGWHGAPSMAAAAQAAINATCLHPTTASTRIGSPQPEEQNARWLSTRSSIGSTPPPLQAQEEQDVERLIQEGEAIAARVANMTKRIAEEGEDLGDDNSGSETGIAIDVDSDDGDRSDSKGTTNPESSRKTGMAALVAKSTPGGDTITSTPRTHPTPGGSKPLPTGSSGRGEMPEGGRNVATMQLTSDEESSTATPSATGSSKSPSSPFNQNTPRTPQGGAVDGKEILRDEEPHYNTWRVKQLRRVALEIAQGENEKMLVFGPEDEDRLGSLSSAKKPALVEALMKRARWCDSTGRAQDYRFWGQMTPEKISKSKGRVSKHAGIRKDAGSVCRMVCLMADSKLLDLYDKAHQEPNRDEQDARAIGAQHRFYKELALAFIDENYENGDGNSISIPVSHANDTPEAPPSLHDALDSLDLHQPAVIVKSGLFRGENGKLDILPLQNAMYKWVKKLKAAHTELQRRLDLSGGVGADDVEPNDDDGDDGGAGNNDGDEGAGGDSEARRAKGKATQKQKDATHTWEFCQRNVAVLLWDDLKRVMGAGDGATTDTIFHDASDLGTTTVRQGTGVTSTDGRSSGDAGGTAKISSKRKKAEALSEERKERQQCLSNVASLLSTLNEREANVASRSNNPSAVEAPLKRVEDAVGKMEATRKMISDLSDSASQLTRQALNAVLRAREKECNEAMREAFGADGGEGGV